MELPYQERWAPEIAEMRRVLAGLAMKEERKWGKPTYTMDGKNIVILQGLKEYFALGFFQGALLKDPRKLLIQLGQVQAGRVMKFTSVQEIAAKATTIKAYVREALAVEICAASALMLLACLPIRDCCALICRIALASCAFSAAISACCSLAASISSAVSRE